MTQTLSKDKDNQRVSNSLTALMLQPHPLPSLLSPTLLPISPFLSLPPPLSLIVAFQSIYIYPLLSTEDEVGNGVKVLETPWRRELPHTHTTALASFFPVHYHHSFLSPFLPSSPFPPLLLLPPPLFFSLSPLPSPLFQPVATYFSALKVKWLMENSEAI